MAAAMRGKMLASFLRTANMMLGINSLLLFITVVHSVEVARPRGVPLSRASLYDVSVNFTCFDGSASFPKNQVNDDYCDCEKDGSDEPGTSACSVGKFYCNNLGHRGEFITSSKVNDGLCDCCDGSDEYESGAQCTDICLDLGKQAREEEERRKELMAQGLEMFQEMAKEGRRRKEECTSKLEQLKGDLEGSRKSREALEAVKKEAEARENEALQKYRDLEAEKKREEEELEMQRHMAEEKANAEEAFNTLDLDMDGILTSKELQQNVLFDKDGDKSVSPEEAKFFLHMKEEMGLDEFVSTGWMIMKPIYNRDKTATTQESPIQPTPTPSGEKEEPQKDQEATSAGEEEDEEEGETASSTEERDGEEDEEDEELEPPEFPPKDKVPEEPAAPAETSKYDPETQDLVDAAKKARDEYNAADEKVRNAESEIRKLEQTLETDYGPEEAYAALRDQCFEFSDREYTYKMCPFDQAAQIPKSGGSETNLGRWGTWDGPEGNKYSRMKFDGGQSCWNGPSRSVVVTIHCGLENQLTSASEPNRCEYHFDFTTPAACSDKSAMEEEESATQHPAHEEL